MRNQSSTESSEESQCGACAEKSNSTQIWFFGLSNSTLAFFGPKESQSKKPFFARFLTVFRTFSTILETILFGVNLIFFIETLMVSRNYRVETKLHGRGVMFRENIEIIENHKK